MPTAEFPRGDVIVLCLVLIGAICALAVLVWAVRRWVFSVSPSGHGESWSLQHLRDMRAQGQITDNEFEALKVKMLEASHRSIQRKDGATWADGS
ncbi:MAG: SHOCT domain-containing protein [Phycisphaerae bacterium]|nr:SHOCT domain-containing protein [Phycisphaerae bacterium]